MKIILFIVFLPVIIFCQTKTGTVKGKVVDADSNYFSMRLANVILIDKKLADSIAQNKNYKIKNVPLGNSVDKNGNYLINNVPFGKYIIKCSFIGYKTEMDSVKLNENNREVIKNFYLKAQPYKMEY